jgi:HSP20 family molecular chaperone IbpA
MPPYDPAGLESEIGRLERSYAAIRRESPGAHDLACRWIAEASGLRWYVIVADVVEADIDVELLREVIVVRADRTWPEPALLLGILPVPGGFDPGQVVIRFSGETLEVRVRREPDRRAS